MLKLFSIDVTYVVSPFFDREAIFSDTTGTVTHVDVATGKRLGNYRGLAGAVTGLTSLEKEQMIATVGLDRFLRVYQRDGERRLMFKVGFLTLVNHIMISPANVYRGLK
jgi:ribosome biogenesis protein NSA1